MSTCPSGSDESVYSQALSPTAATREATQAEYTSLDTEWSTLLTPPSIHDCCIRNTAGTLPSSPFSIHLRALCPLIHLIPL